MRKNIDFFELKKDIPGHLAALSFGIQSLLLTGVIKLIHNPDDNKGIKFLSLIREPSLHFFLILILAFALTISAIRLFKTGMHLKGSLFAVLAVLIGLNLLHLPAFLLIIHSTIIMILSVILASKGMRKFRICAARGIFAVLGMIVFDLASDLPFLFAGKHIEISYLNNTIHNGTLVHLLWLPLSLSLIGFGIGLGLYQKQRGALLWLIPLLAVGGILLYGVVEPNEAVLETVTADSVKAANLLHSIASAHLASFFILLIGVRLLYTRNKKEI